MSKHRKVFKFRMQPTALQADELMRMTGTARFIWNWALERCKTFYKENSVDSVSDPRQWATLHEAGIPRL